MYIDTALDELSANYRAIRAISLIRVDQLGIYDEVVYVPSSEHSYNSSTYSHSSDEENHIK